MSKEIESVEEVDETTDQTEETTLEVDISTAKAEEVNEEESEASDLVAEAMAEKARLEAELEALKVDDLNVFEQNAKLKAKLEEARKLQEVASENAKLKAQLEDAKRQTIIDSMLKNGQINNNLKGVVEGLSFDQLQEMQKHLPRRKSILEQTNETTKADATMLEFVKQQSKSRIIS